MVGLGRIELPTSRLSGVRSSHLSYRPDHLNRPVAMTFDPTSSTDVQDQRSHARLTSWDVEVY